MNKILGRPVRLAVDQRGNYYSSSDNIAHCLITVSPLSLKK
jgi:hypothetical protein